jgi:hypothetical protein
MQPRLRPRRSGRNSAARHRILIRGECPQGRGKFVIDAQTPPARWPVKSEVQCRGSEAEEVRSGWRVHCGRAGKSAARRLRLEHGGGKWATAGAGCRVRRYSERRERRTAEAVSAHWFPRSAGAASALPSGPSAECRGMKGAATAVRFPAPRRGPRVRRRGKVLDDSSKKYNVTAYPPGRFGGRAQSRLRAAFACLEADIRTSVYIDGFNFYYGALRRTPYRWVNPEKLCQLLLPKNTITQIKYFTALVSARPGDPGQTVRQQLFVDARNHPRSCSQTERIPARIS